MQNFTTLSIFVHKSNALTFLLACTHIPFSVQKLTIILFLYIQFRCVAGIYDGYG